MNRLVRCVVGFGSNLGDRSQLLQKAREAVDHLWEEPQYSDIYETLPWGLLDQPCFLNQVGWGWTRQTPITLIKELKKIEEAMGRIEGPRYGPRVIDLDILYFGDWIMVSDLLTIPHLRLQERAFTLVPLAQVLPEFVHPKNQRTQQELLQLLDPDAGQCSVWAPEVKKKEGSS